jgi:hypothetical protein
MPKFRNLLGPAVLVWTVGSPAVVRAADPPPPPQCAPKCAELPTMETELFNQEYLQARFKKYLTYDVVPVPGPTPDPDHPGKMVQENMIEAMQRDAQEALNRFMESPAGGGQKGAAAPGAGTSSDCVIHLYKPGGKMIAYDDASYRKSHKCWDAEFLLSHERQHVVDCKAGLKINDDYEAYAASDVRAYGAGVKKLRELVAETAKRCGWKGSTKKDKKNPVDQSDEPVVPTPADVNDILSALKTAPTPAGRGGKK